MTARPSDAVVEGTSAPPAPYEELRRRHVREQMARLPVLLERITWSAKQLAAGRLDRLRTLLRVAKDRSPWYRERLAGIEPSSFVEAKLNLIPPMSKQDLMDNFDTIVTDRRLTLDRVEAHLERLGQHPLYLLDHYHAIASGGSSGVRGVFVYDWDAWTTAYIGWVRYLVRFLGTTRFGMAVVAAGQASHGSRALLQTFADPEGITVHSVPVTLPQHEILARLNTIQPDVLVAYPTALQHLASAQAHGDLRISPRAVVTGGEPLLREIRAAAEGVWRVPIHNWWLSSEGQPMAIGCGRGPGLHLSDDLVVIEPVDREGAPVPPGVRSDKVYLTNAYNLALPLVRYELTDEVVVLDEPCPCGSAHRLIGDVEGRMDDTFVYPGGVVIHPHVFRSALGRESGIAEYQVRQTRGGASIHLRLTRDVDLERLRIVLVRDLQQLGLRDPVLSLKEVADIERQATGKLKRFVPNAGPH